jgi:hypothetical protein
MALISRSAVGGDRCRDPKAASNRSHTTDCALHSSIEFIPTMIRSAHAGGRIAIQLRCTAATQSVTCEDYGEC